MQRKFFKRNGNSYTLVSIVIVIIMMYLFKFTMEDTQSDYPQYVYYDESKYQYSQTIRESSWKFVRKYGKSYDGYILLLKRGENKSTPARVYIFTGWKKYREYKLIQ